MGLYRHRARPHRLHQRAVARLCHRRRGGDGRASFSTRRCRRRREAHQRSPRLGGGRRRRISPSRRIGPRGSNISTASTIAANVRFSAPALPYGTVDRLPADPHRPQPQGRLAGLARLDAEDRIDRYRIRPLGNPRPDHLLPQGYPSFRAPYTGPNSLTPAPQAQATWSNSLFLNARLWQGGEVYYNPELLQGFGLNDTVGAAGFPNGEAQKSNFPYPHYNTSRLFLAPDLRLRRRAGRIRHAAQPTRRQGRRLAS